MKIPGASVIECLSTHRRGFGKHLNFFRNIGERGDRTKAWQAASRRAPHSSRSHLDRYPFLLAKTACLICASTARAKCLKRSGLVASDASGARFLITFHAHTNPAGG
jgi:hypothetical protein